ncbi:MAG: hypothetical protein CL946_00490 [Ectothiorhodospiraceae bacterium]|nr:hypothetical protein [Ectothiorhodospiraceae bacterium]
MGKALSIDLRQRILADRDRGLAALAIAEKYQFARRTVNGLVHHRERTGSLEPVRGRQGRKSTLEPRKAEILRAMQANPSLTLQQLKTQLKLKIALSSLWVALRGWGIRLKKSSARR